MSALKSMMSTTTTPATTTPFQIDITSLTYLRMLGKGRTGVVNLYSDDIPSSFSKTQKRYYAIKTTPRTQTPQKTKSILSEKKILLLLNSHPLTPYLYGTSKDLESLYFIFKPLLSPLHVHMRGQESGYFRVNNAKYYVLQIASVLLYMNYRKIIHRDIKLSNILLDSDGNCVLCDFGSACVLERRSLEERRKTFCGTLHCLSPEMLDCEISTSTTTKEQGSHGYKTDWWSLGILLYEMMTGKPPFGYGIGEDRADCCGLIRAGLPPPSLLAQEEKEGEEDEEGSESLLFPNSIFSGVSLGSEDLIRRLLTVNESNRLSNFIALSEHSLFKEFEFTFEKDGVMSILFPKCSPDFDESLGGIDEEVGGRSGGIDEDVGGDVFKGF